MKKDLAHRTEYVLLRAAVGAVNMLPHAVAIALARGVAWLMFHVFRFKRARTLKRIRTVFPGIPDREARRIARESLSNMACNAVEMFRAHKFTKKWIDAHVEDIGVYAERLRALQGLGRGVVVMVPHMGNWDMAAWAMARHGVRLFALAARQKNPYVDAWMNRMRSTGMEVVMRGSPRTMREIVSRLAAGQAFAILPDLRVPQKDVQVPFLGGTANVSHAGASFALSNGSPVVVAVLRRKGRKHTFSHLATIMPRPESEWPQAPTKAARRRLETERIMREAMALLDKEIRSTPGQWFWYNKRWLLQPL